MVNLLLHFNPPLLPVPAYTLKDGFGIRQDHNRGELPTPGHLFDSPLTKATDHPQQLPNTISFLVWAYPCPGVVGAPHFEQKREFGSNRAPHWSQNEAPTVAWGASGVATDPGVTAAFAANCFCNSRTRLREAQLTKKSNTPSAATARQITTINSTVLKLLPELEVESGGGGVGLGEGEAVELGEGLPVAPGSLNRRKPLAIPWKISSPFPCCWPSVSISIPG
jgi:hypothetical protein